MRAVRENIQPRSCCIGRAIARSIQQDRGWIFSRTARTVEVSKFFIIWHCTFVKNEEKRSREGKVQSPKHLQKRTNYCKKCSQAWLVKLLYRTFYIEYYKHSWIVFQEKYEVFRHLIKDKDNKYENNKINKQYGKVRF